MLVLGLFLTNIIGCLCLIPGREPRGISWEAKRDVLKRWDIIPDIIDDLPIYTIKIKYKDGYEPIFYSHVKPNESIKEAPVSTRWPIESNTTLYTLMLLDPDMPMPGKPEWREYRNWLVGNIPGNATFAGTILSSYEPPTVVYPSGGHRVLFLVYKQKGEIEFEETLADEREDGKDRRHFSVKKWAEKYDLGKPIACFLFVSTWFFYLDK